MKPMKPMPISAPGDEFVVVVTSDTADLDVPTNGAKIYVGVSGDVCVDGAVSGTAVVFKNAVAGSILPILVKRVRATNTTATNLVAVF